jgi:hypothetical protein
MKVREALARVRDGIRQAGTAALDADIGKMGAFVGRWALRLALPCLLVAAGMLALAPPNIGFIEACERVEASKYSAAHPGVSSREAEVEAQHLCYRLALEFTQRHAEVPEPPSECYYVEEPHKPGGGQVMSLQCPTEELDRKVGEATARAIAAANLENSRRLAARRAWLRQHPEADIRARVRAAIGLQPWDESMYFLPSQ